MARQRTAHRHQRCIRLIESLNPRHGLMQNLVVTEGESGRYCVIEGARRLEALLSLQAEGKLPEDHAVPCQVVGTEQALEKSLAA
ncbi:ParB/Srx family N-terminal domain-containing protein, partial [Bremerella sp. JC817]|uniref:ParB/Srx family N-terminal domain-containing protein n=1 Tax=Bremerella sp. JC817 TaxID=3231756 RepID=UPI003459844C